MIIVKHRTSKKICISVLATILLTGGMGFRIHKIKAAQSANETLIENDEVMVKGEGNAIYILNKNYATFTINMFHDVVGDRVGDEVKIWDVENDIKKDLDVIRKKATKHDDGYHLITNEERNDLVKSANKRGMSLKDYLQESGIDMSNAPKYMTSAYGGQNRIWHYGGTFVKPHTEIYQRRLFFEKFNITDNHFDNTMIGFIDCSTEDNDRFLKHPTPSRYWHYISDEQDHFEEFSANDYLLLFVKN